MVQYEKPSLTSRDGIELVENEVPVIVVALGWALLIFGCAWAFCQATCGWMNVKSCEVSISAQTLKAVCKS